jgi:hypothetical protein
MRFYFFIFALDSASGHVDWTSLSTLSSGHVDWTGVEVVDWTGVYKVKNRLTGKP